MSKEKRKQERIIKWIIRALVIMGISAIAFFSIIALASLYFFGYFDSYIDQGRSYLKINNEKEEMAKILADGIKNNYSSGIDKTDFFASRSNLKELGKRSMNYNKFGWRRDISLVLSENVPEDFALRNNLPPDPGRKGNKIVLGVDSNANQVMDDLERVIEYNFRDEPELRAIYLAGAVASYRNLKNSIAKNFSIENLKKANKSISDYVACEDFYSIKKGVRSYLSEISKLERYPNKERMNFLTEIAVKANMYEHTTSLESILSGGKDTREVFVEGSKEYCRNFVSQYGFLF